jgi:long-chain acyl-CoA synthetase
MSTAFVAGNRSGLVFEDEEVIGYFPRKDELDGRDFSLEQELADAEKIVARLREQADDKALASTFREKALERLREEGRDFNDEKTLRLAVGRERKLWLTLRLVEAGMERAKHWGWPNTYTYTKSLGEQVLAATPGLRYAIVRPSIVESAQRYPFPGWNEGFTTSAPIIYALIKGQSALPASDKAVLDMIPVDQVSGSLIAITAQALRTSERRVYQQATGDSSPFIASRSVELVGLYKRRRWRNKETGNATLNELKSRIEPKSLSKPVFDFTNSPLFSKGAKWLNAQIDENRPTWGAPKVNALLDKVKEQLSDVADQADGVNMIVDLFLPFIWNNRYVFRCDNTRSLYVGMPAHDRAKIDWNPEAIDWRTYFLDTHIPGLEKWVFPGLDEETEKRKVVHAYRDLLELLDATADRRLDTCDPPRWRDEAAVSVVMASAGYPGPVERGQPIRGLDAAARLPDVQVFHAATRAVDGAIVADGGRVLAVTALGPSLARAKLQAYTAVKEIRWPGAWCRKDIADKGLNFERQAASLIVEAAAPSPAEEQP